MKKILIIEDDLAIGNLMKMAFELNQFSYELSVTGQDALQKILSYQPHIIILDLGLPDLDGTEIIKKVRSWSKTPIIVVSARDDETDKIEALDLGADDYITKPFSIDELLARIRVALRRVDEIQPASNLFTNGPLTINFLSQDVCVNEHEIYLTPNEYLLLEVLSRNVGKVLTHNFLLKSIWQDALDTDIPNLRVFMATLRKKLEIADSPLIQTHIRVGYRMIHY
ncbi:DNA-binding response regulator [Kurthia zopfii]|uniref:KDP operon transcriptional regulatory protein KdpE n=1 Tax=Kurthia zopfii TaxID=1650 RepID=A0A8B4QAR1_9BACL|nr:response regulator transcription factor [Kurthia zopfii]PWI23150.1 DNA-binding response regulator [Kurthia zopfii]TDR41328.1 two-component system KDP operon response regulator KdpE [Kurthia zopfii]GEK29970.1 DNA-binding response regulator [Kurthia zopfii]STX09833.1 KDP operon transcriptional regulatory protein KdpE [Kurthia zopfii]